MTLPMPSAVWQKRAVVLAVLILAALALWFAARPSASAEGVPTSLVLVVPDGLRDDDVLVMAWRDAAAEAGFPMSVIGASQLLREDTLHREAALILPDTLHRKMNDALLAHIASRVRAGARLMLVHDAGVSDMAGAYHPQQSRLSELAGVRYALYGQLGTGMTREQAAWVDAPALPQLRLPPGKLVRSGGDRPLTSGQPAPQPGERLAVVGYKYGRLHYPVFVTDGDFKGLRLVQGDGDSLLAGVHGVGRGVVLFINLPLTYLKLRTDGLFLATFMRYFAQDIAQLPQLSPMPDARGALVMNWHIDSAAAVPAMQKLSALGAFDQGPYSVHLTTGPDVDRPGDRGGMDLANNPTMQEWVRRFSERGDEIGSHGGWIHNEFGRLIGTQDRALSTALIERNSAAIRDTSGRAVREYSAPTGNHPAWVTPWLREHGINAYYFTGDIGMPPTRSYQDGQRGPSDIWAFPVLSYGSDAAFEEAQARKVPEDDVAAWLRDVSDYCADNRSVRLVYFHPPGIALFPQAFKRWLEHTVKLVRAERLRWTTMTRYADFANRRLKVQWRLARVGGALRLEASHPTSLAHMSWLLPAQRFGQPKVLEGSAEVTRDGDFWRVVADGTRQLALSLPAAAEADGAASAAPLRDERAPSWQAP